MKSNALADSLTADTAEADTGEGHIEADPETGLVDARDIKPYKPGPPRDRGAEPPKSDLAALERNPVPERRGLRRHDIDLLSSATLAGTLDPVDLTKVDTTKAETTLSDPNDPGGAPIEAEVDGDTVEYEASPGRWQQKSNQWLRKEVARVLRVAHHRGVPDDLRAVFVTEAREMMALLLSRARAAGIGQHSIARGDIELDGFRGGPGTESELPDDHPLKERFGPTQFGPEYANDGHIGAD